MKAKNILITGGTGLVGTRLSKMLMAQDYAISVLTRGKTDTSGAIKKYHWDTDKGVIDEAALQGADYIVNLAGASIAGGRWTAQRKEEIYTSRIASTMLLSKKLEEAGHSLKGFISVSGSGYYGDTGDQWLTETTPPGASFLAKVCKDWEVQAQTVAAQGIRTVICRLAVVLAREGGALPELEKTMNFGIAAYLGSGKQYYSWIHIEDLCRFFIFAIENETMAGVYNIAGNNPVPNKELVEAIKEAKGAHAVLVPAPEFALKVALGEMRQTVLQSQRMSNQKLLDTGFQLRHAELKYALANLYKKI